MKLVALQDFGHLKAGDTVEVPDGDDFAHGYFAVAEKGKKPQVPASSTPVAEGLKDEQDEAPAKEED